MWNNKYEHGVKFAFFLKGHWYNCHLQKSGKLLDLKQISIKIGCSFQTNYTIMKDQFLNYVIQKMIDMVKLPQPRNCLKLLMDRIWHHVTTLYKYTYGKHIFAQFKNEVLYDNKINTRFSSLDKWSLALETYRYWWSYPFLFLGGGGITCLLNFYRMF